MPTKDLIGLTSGFLYKYLIKFAPHREKLTIQYTQSVLIRNSPMTIPYTQIIQKVVCIGIIFIIYNI